MPKKCWWRQLQPLGMTGKTNDFDNASTHYGRHCWRSIAWSMKWSRSFEPSHTTSNGYCSTDPWAGNITNLLSFTGPATSIDQWSRSDGWIIMDGRRPTVTLPIQNRRSLGFQLADYIEIRLDWYGDWLSIAIRLFVDPFAAKLHAKTLCRLNRCLWLFALE